MNNVQKASELGERIQDEGKIYLESLSRTITKTSSLSFFM